MARPGPALAPRTVAPPASSYRAPERLGSRQIAPNVPNRNMSAFGGIENGGTQRAHVEHGYSSLGPSRSAPRGGGGGGGHRR